MKSVGLVVVRITLALSALLTVTSCISSPGSDGSRTIDCGEHGSAHGEHCHCDQGFLYDGKTCVSPDKITEICQAHDHEADGEPDDASDHEDDEHHAHADKSCLCPTEGQCPCDGEIQEIANRKYCVPDLHHEDHE